MIVKPILSAADAAGRIKEGDSLMVGGFLACGSPHTIILALKAKGTKNLTLICNDTAVHDFKSGKISGVAHLIQGRQFKKIIASHIGTNQETQRQMNAGETEVELIPQGTLAEQVRAGGAGLGGFLTPTGVGTEVAVGKQVIVVAHKPFLLELPLKADVAIIKAKKADKSGDVEEAEALRSQKEEVNIPAPIVESNVPKVKGTSVMERWAFRIVDEDKIPRQYMKPDLVTLGKIARASHDKMEIPGVEFYAEKAITTRGA